MKISIEQLEFPMCIKNKILRMKDITKLQIDYIAGKYIRFDKTNLALQEPYKIIISNESYCITLVAYEDDTTLYSLDLSRHITSNDLSQIVKTLSK